MPPATASLSVLVGKDFACSPDFKTLLNELANKGYGHFIIDLSECALMDSTFLGVLAGFGIRLNPQGAPKEKGIELVNTKPRVSELLENLGTIHLFNLTSGPLHLSGEAQPCPPAPPESSRPSREEITRTSLEAHETLMAMNPENVARFKDVARFLAEDLKNVDKPS